MARKELTVLTTGKFAEPKTATTATSKKDSPLIPNVAKVEDAADPRRRG